MRGIKFVRDMQIREAKTDLAGLLLYRAISIALKNNSPWVVKNYLIKDLTGKDELTAADLIDSMIHNQIDNATKKSI